MGGINKENMEGKKSVYVGIPSFSVSGFVMDDGVLDACAETLEIPSSKIKVIERDSDFYLFTDEIPLDIHSANQTIVTAQNLNKDYEHAVHFLTKLVRRSDAQINKQRELTVDVNSLKSENKKLKLKLQNLEKEIQEKKLKSKKVETELEAAVANIQ